jgi:hypothetical protein
MRLIAAGLRRTAVADPAEQFKGKGRHSGPTPPHEKTRGHAIAVGEAFNEPRHATAASGRVIQPPGISRMTSP